MLGLEFLPDKVDGLAKVVERETVEVDDLVVDVLEHADTWTTPYDALDLMLNEGYLGRSTRNFNALVQEAGRKREKRIAGK